MYFDDSQSPDLPQQIDDDDDEPGEVDETIPCSRGHRSSLNLRTAQGGAICLVCVANLLTACPRPSTLHVSYALSQLSQALSQPPFLKSLLTFHSHFLTSPLVHALSSFDDEPIARQIIDLVSDVCVRGGGLSLAREFVARISSVLSSRALAWSRRQCFTLNCLGVLLNCQEEGCITSIKDKDGLISNLVTGLQLPSEDIRGEILFVLYKFSLHLYSSMEGDEPDPFLPYCPKLLYLSLDALQKTVSDDVRSNCIALLTVLTHRGLLQSPYANCTSSLAPGSDDSIQISNSPDGLPLHSLFAEAIKGPLLSSDEQVQSGILDLIFHYLSCEKDQMKKIQLLVESSVGDYIFEILRLPGK
ncbi:hypothetical protein SAY87_004446 [Trapa incisa]|uniref:Uncharacterized protein n=1 Tax=Trapa incisa TaxID=236973 RepID=A0AAN7PMA7_9MYRT|nr:hypothetical protein SAY87_004446 [Trapa incisa]